jgi:hypothetical protein
MDRLRQEVELHEQARKADGAFEPAGDRLDRHPRIYAWAWLRAVADQLEQKFGEPLDRCEPTSESRTGPTMMIWHAWDKSRKEWPGSEPLGFWVQLTAGLGFRERKAAIKVGAPRPAIRAALAKGAWNRFAPELDGWSKGRGATIWTRDLSADSAGQVAEFCHQVSVLAGKHGAELVEEASTAGSETPP